MQSKFGGCRGRLRTGDLRLAARYVRHEGDDTPVLHEQRRLMTVLWNEEGQIEVVEHEASIQRYFHVASAEEIYERLQEEKDKNAWAETAHKALHKKSPTSVKAQTPISMNRITCTAMRC